VERLVGSAERYILMLAHRVAAERPSGRAVVCRLADGGALVDALDDARAARALLDALATADRSVGETFVILATCAGPLPTAPECSPLPSRSRSTKVACGDGLALELFRRVDAGTSPRLEVGRALAGTGLVPELRGFAELRRGDDEPATIAVVEVMPAHGVLAWESGLQEVRRFYDRVLARPPGSDAPQPQLASALALAGQEPPADVATMMGAYRETAGRIGQRVAEFHRTLASRPGAAFSPEPYGALDRRAKAQSMRTLANRVLRLLGEQKGALPAHARGDAETVLANAARILGSFVPLATSNMATLKSRVHGDLHLGTLMWDGRDYVVLDVGGNLDRTVEERRRKRSPLSDLVGVVWSFEVLALKVLLDPALVRESDASRARPWALQWAGWMGAETVRAYLSIMNGTGLVPANPEATAVLYDALSLERALYHLGRQLERRSRAVSIPLLGIARRLEVTSDA